jgi:GMP synthase-like glutamine amidotransferase
MMNKKMRIAVLSTDSPDGVQRDFRGKNRGISKILRMRLHEIAKNQQVDLRLNTYSLTKKHNLFPDPADFQAIVISGSMSDISNKYLLDTPWMKSLLSFIRDAHEELPMLGICFGHQAIARAFDSHLEDLHVPEEGFYPVSLTTHAKNDPLFIGVPERFMALFSHSQYVPAPPPGVALVMGDSPSVQAFRVGKSTWGMQFHPDFSPGTVRSALLARRKELENRMDIEKALHRLEIPDEARDDTKPLVNFVKLAAKIL